MKLKRLAVLAGCAMWMVSAHATDRVSPPGGKRQVHALASDGTMVDVRSFIQGIDGPRAVISASNPPPAPSATAVLKAAVSGSLLPAVASTIPEPPSLWLMLLGLFATGLALTRRRFD